jgi:phytoene dehydrogenase-like protein
MLLLVHIQTYQHLITQAAYLQKAGLNVLVLERRHVLGGAAVTEEIVPGIFSCVIIAQYM